MLCGWLIDWLQKLQEKEMKVGWFHGSNLQEYQILSAAINQPTNQLQNK